MALFWESRLISRLCYMCGHHGSSVGQVLYYRPQRSCGQGNIFTPVCHSFCSRGGSASVHAGIQPPQDQTPRPGRHPPRSIHPPGTRQTPPDQADTPQTRQTPPPDQADTPQTRQTPPGSRLQHMVNEWPVCILLECILVICVSLQ